MCRHIYRTINSVRVCQRCGLTINLINGAVMFDRRLPDYRKKKDKGSGK